MPCGSAFSPDLVQGLINYLLQVIGIDAGVFRLNFLHGFVEDTPAYGVLKQTWKGRLFSFHALAYADMRLSR